VALDRYQRYAHTKRRRAARKTSTLAQGGGLKEAVLLERSQWRDGIAAGKSFLHRGAELSDPWIHLTMCRLVAPHDCSLVNSAK
jgi:hypothetical protein